MIVLDFMLMTIFVISNIGIIFCMKEVVDELDYQFMGYVICGFDWESPCAATLVHSSYMLTSAQCLHKGTCTAALLKVHVKHRAIHVKVVRQIAQEVVQIPNTPYVVGNVGLVQIIPPKIWEIPVVPIAATNVTYFLENPSRCESVKWNPYSNVLEYVHILEYPNAGHFLTCQELIEEESLEEKYCSKIAVFKQVLKDFSPDACAAHLDSIPLICEGQQIGLFVKCRKIPALFYEDPVIYYLEWTLLLENLDWIYSVIYEERKAEPKQHQYDSIESIKTNTERSVNISDVRTESYREPTLNYIQKIIKKYIGDKPSISRKLEAIQETGNTFNKNVRIESIPRLHEIEEFLTKDTRNGFMNEQQEGNRTIKVNTIFPALYDNISNASILISDKLNLLNETKRHIIGETMNEHSKNNSDVIAIASKSSNRNTTRNKAMLPSVRTNLITESTPRQQFQIKNETLTSSDRTYIVSEREDNSLSKIKELLVIPTAKLYRSRSNVKMANESNMYKHEQTQEFKISNATLNRSDIPYNLYDVEDDDLSKVKELFAIPTTKSYATRTENKTVTNLNIINESNTYNHEQTQQSEISNASFTSDFGYNDYEIENRDLNKINDFFGITRNRLEKDVQTQQFNVNNETLSSSDISYNYYETENRDLNKIKEFFGITRNRQEEHMQTQQFKINNESLSSSDISYNDYEIENRDLNKIKEFFGITINRPEKHIHTQQFKISTKAITPSPISNTASDIENSDLNRIRELLGKRNSFIISNKITKNNKTNGTNILTVGASISDSDILKPSQLPRSVTNVFTEKEQTVENLNKLEQFLDMYINSLAQNSLNTDGNDAEKIRIEKEFDELQKFLQLYVGLTGKTKFSWAEESIIDNNHKFFSRPEDNTTSSYDDSIIKMKDNVDLDENDPHVVDESRIILLNRTRGENLTGQEQFVANISTVMVNLTGQEQFLANISLEMLIGDESEDELEEELAETTTDMEIVLQTRAPVTKKTKERRLHVYSSFRTRRDSPVKINTTTVPSTTSVQTLQIASSSQISLLCCSPSFISFVLSILCLFGPSTPINRL